MNRNGYKELVLQEIFTYNSSFLSFAFFFSFFSFFFSFLGEGVKFEAQGGAYMVLIFLAILRLAVLIDVVLIKKKRVGSELYI